MRTPRSSSVSRMTACGLDFGTSNSGVALPSAGSIRLVDLEEGSTSIPSAVFFRDRATAAGHLWPRSGPRLSRRHARAPDALAQEPSRQRPDRREDRGRRSQHRVHRHPHALPAHAARARRARAPARPSTPWSWDGRCVSSTMILSRTGDAQATLGACARAAGFRHLEFQFEPIAAAFDYERTIAREEAVLVIDVGGGTADFTVIRLGPDRRLRTDRAQDVLANDGIHIAGTDFDSRLNLSWVMPSLGHGSVGRKGLDHAEFDLLRPVDLASHQPALCARRARVVAGTAVLLPRSRTLRKAAAGDRAAAGPRTARRAPKRPRSNCRARSGR